jgi:hypothetical protein
LLEYQLVGRDLVAFAVTATRVHAQYTRLPRGIEGRVNRLLRACAGGGAATQEENELAAILLEPFAAVLGPAKRVIVVPSGGLSALPFHLLPLGGKAFRRRGAWSPIYRPHCCCRAAASIARWPQALRW